MVLWIIVIMLAALWWMGLMAGYTMGLFIHALIVVAIILLLISINREVSIYQELKKKLQETARDRKYKNIREA